MELPTMASLAVCLSFPGRAIGTKNVAIASLHLERIGRVLPCVAQRPPTSMRTAPAHPELAFGSARARPAQLIEVVVLVAGVFNDDTTVYGGIHIHVDTITRISIDAMTISRGADACLSRACRRRRRERHRGRQRGHCDD